ncbi:MAG: hypothetical protein ABUT20_30765 [Bacteroidota bacterium]
MKKAGAFLFRYTFLLFTLFFLIAYLPVFLPFFHLKNDLVTQNLPTRFVISESLYSGFFPWWNPYINFGIPQYGDMNNGFWNPFIWIISKTTGFNIYSITIEEMLYVLFGGWGIYKMSYELFNKETAIVSGITYMACGYIVGHLQHFCWITGTAFFPYVLLFYIRANKNPALKNFIAGAISLFFFLASTHPGLIIGALYFFLFAIALIFIYRKNYCAFLYGKKFWIINGIFFLSGVLLSTVVIVSNIDVLQHISRGLKISTEQMLLNPTTLQSYLSLLVPLAVNKSTFFMTDISMRNVYTGIGGLFGIGIFLKYTRIRVILTIAVPLLFFMLLSAGGTFKLFFSSFVPLVGYVRMNGEFNYFVILILILLSSAGLNHYLSTKKETDLKKFLYYSVWIFSGFIIIATTYMIINKEPLFSFLPENLSFTKKNIKNIIDNLSFWQLLLIGSLFQLITILLLKKKQDKKNIVLLILCMNLAATTWLSLPFTGLGTRSKKEFDSLISKSGKGIHTPELKSINNTAYLDSSLLNDLWLIPSYSKKIGYKKEELYPIQLRSNQNFFSDQQLLQFITNQSYIFLSKDTSIDTNTSSDSAFINVIAFGPGYIKASLVNTDFNYITLLQNDYPYWRVKINGNESLHFTGFKTFISASLPKGKSIIEFIFNPIPIKIALWISIVLGIAGVAVLLKSQWRNKVILR